MVRIRGQYCEKCADRGSFFTGEGFEECDACDGENHSEEIDRVVDINDDFSEEDESDELEEND